MIPTILLMTLRIYVCLFDRHVFTTPERSMHLVPFNLYLLVFFVTEEVWLAYGQPTSHSYAGLGGHLGPPRIMNTHTHGTKLIP